METNLILLGVVIGVGITRLWCFIERLIDDRRIISACKKHDENYSCVAFNQDSTCAHVYGRFPKKARSEYLAGRSKVVEIPRAK